MGAPKRPEKVLQQPFINSLSFPNSLYYLLTIASFRIGVPSILFNYKFNEKKTKKLNFDLKWDESGNLLYTNSARNYLVYAKLFDVFELIYISI